jgi:hypothetical protein
VVNAWSFISQADAWQAPWSLCDKPPVSTKDSVIRAGGEKEQESLCNQISLRRPVHRLSQRRNMAASHEAVLLRVLAF